MPPAPSPPSPLPSPDRLLYPPKIKEQRFDCVACSKTVEARARGSRKGVEAKGGPVLGERAGVGRCRRRSCRPSPASSPPPRPARFCPLVRSSSLAARRGWDRRWAWARQRPEGGGGRCGAGGGGVAAVLPDGHGQPPQPHRVLRRRHVGPRPESPNLHPEFDALTRVMFFLPPESCSIFIYLFLLA